MSRQLPINQVRLTNVAIVRLARAGHRFEVACYRNKILNYRQGTETDLSEVLQTERVFTNVSKGQFANTKILQQCFDTTDELEVCRFILDKGDVQISDQERAAQHESTLREVASMVTEKCVRPGSRRPYTMAQVRDAMKRAGFMVHPTHNVKQQFLDCVKLLQRTGTLEIERAKMELALVIFDDGGGGGAHDDDDDHAIGFASTSTSSSSSDLVERRANAIDLLVKEGVSRSDILSPYREDDSSRQIRIIFQSDPSLYRKVENIARNTSVRGRLEIIHQCVSTDEGDVTLGSELERMRVQQEQQQQREDDIILEEESTRSELLSPSTLENTLDHSLSDKLQSYLTIDDSDDENQNDSLTTTTANATNHSRKAQKAAQKKSKKAKRREKEEQAERGQRIAAEKTRQRERAERLGIADEQCIDSVPSLTNLSGENTIQEGGGEGVRADVKPCNTCGGAFTPGEYRLHFRSDWHRYNVKLKMKSVPPVSEKEFLLCDSDAFFEL